MKEKLENPKKHSQKANKTAANSNKEIKSRSSKTTMAIGQKNGKKGQKVWKKTQQGGKFQGRASSQVARLERGCVALTLPTAAAEEPVPAAP